MLDEMTCRQKASNSIFSLNEFAGHHRGKKFKACEMEKTTFLHNTTYMKYGKFWSVLPGHLIKQKTFISEE